MASFGRVLLAVHPDFNKSTLLRNTSSAGKAVARFLVAAYCAFYTSMHRSGRPRIMAFVLANPQRG